MIRANFVVPSFVLIELHDIFHKVSTAYALLVAFYEL